jgi:dihydropteroate synthase
MTINCKGQLIDLSSPMGILNITQTHFDGGKFTNESEILAQVDKMLTEGATL